jgi:hypothetical protein
MGLHQALDIPPPLTVNPKRKRSQSNEKTLKAIPRVRLCFPQGREAVG